MTKGKAVRLVSTGTILVGGFGWLFIQQVLGGGGCGGFTPQTSGGSSLIVHAPTVSVATIAWELHLRHSPLSAADAVFIYQQSQAYSIDDAFALALWAEETQDGATAFAGTDNIGNVTGTPGITVTGDDGVTRTFRTYASWQEAIAAWFLMIETLYIRGGHASDLGTFALYYVHGLLPDAPTAAQVRSQMEAAPNPQTGAPGGYVWQVEQIIGTLATHESETKAGGSPPGPGGGGNGAGGLTLASLLPSGVSHAWASPDALQAAATLSVQSCLSGIGTGTPLVSRTLLLEKVLVLAGHLASDGTFFDRWGAGTPGGVLAQGGTTWCTDFIASVFQVVTGKAFPAYPDAEEWLTTVGQAPGFQAFLPTPGQYPQPGEVVVLGTRWKGHVALVVGVHPPQGTQNGSLLVVQGHATRVFERWTLFPDGTALPPWADSATRTLGYIQMPALTPASVTTRVHPLIQADPNAGYDSQAQHDAFWNADCAAAVLTEVLRAWGVNVTIGQVIDALSSHQPDPYLTSWGGLMSQAAFDWLARQYHLQASVQEGRSLSYQAILSLAGQGIPVIIGVRDSTGASYPAFSVGHFLVVTGGDATHLQVVDSSLYRITSLSEIVLTALWTGETVVITPV